MGKLTFTRHKAQKAQTLVGSEPNKVVVPPPVPKQKKAEEKPPPKAPPKADKWRASDADK